MKKEKKGDVKINNHFELKYFLEVRKNGLTNPVYSCATLDFKNISDRTKYLVPFMDKDYILVLNFNNEKREYPLTSDFKLEDFGK